MKISSECIGCIFDKQVKVANQYDSPLNIEFLKKVSLYLSTISENMSSVELSTVFSEMQYSFFGKKQDFAEKKRYANTWALSVEDDIRKKINSSADPIRCALKYAIVGNYLDYAVIDEVKEVQLLELLEQLNDDFFMENDSVSLFLYDITHAKKIVYITDNCGEIVFDKLFMEQILQKYNVDIDVIVRGVSVLNDATIDDAMCVGLDRIANIIENGTKHAGTVISQISDTAYSSLHHSDLIISKGQGNYETLNGCGLNVYYTFLCKCDYFVRKFSVSKYEPMFIHESRK